MSNRETHHSDSYKNFRKLPLNIQMAVCLFASVLQRMVARQQQFEAQDQGKAVKQEQANL